MIVETETEQPEVVATEDTQVKGVVYERPAPAAPAPMGTLAQTGLAVSSLAALGLGLTLLGLAFRMAGRRRTV